MFDLHIQIPLHYYKLFPPVLITWVATASFRGQSLALLQVGSLLGLNEIFLTNETSACSIILLLLAATVHCVVLKTEILHVMFELLRTIRH